MKRKFIGFICILIIVSILAITIAGCSQAKYDKFTLNGWESIALKRLGKTAQEVDIAKLRVEDFIDISGISNDTYLYTDGDKRENGEGWYATLI